LERGSRQILLWRI